MPPSVTFLQRLKEISLFLEKRDEVYKTLRRLVKRLEKAGIAYALVGGMAVNAHKYIRTTGDVDILLTPEAIAEFCKRFVPKFYERVPPRARRFMDKKNRIIVDVLVSGMFPGSGAPGPIRFPDPEDKRESIQGIQVIGLATLVELKLAARRHRDFGDVVELIRFNELDKSFQQKLDPSVRRDYIECLEEKRREDEYIAKNG
jgi:hypothetical protein